MGTEKLLFVSLLLTAYGALTLAPFILNWWMGEEEDDG